MGYLLYYALYMSAKGDPSHSMPEPPSQSTVLLLLGDIADTTWRMFLPTLGCIGLGFWGDASWNTKPWLTIVGIIIGVSITALLVRRQFKKVQKTK